MMTDAEIRYGFMLDGELLHVEKNRYGYQLVEVRGTYTALGRIHPSIPWMTPLPAHFIEVWAGSKESWYLMDTPRLDTSSLKGTPCPVAIVKRFGQGDTLYTVEYRKVVMPGCLLACPPAPLCSTASRQLFISKLVGMGSLYYTGSGKTLAVVKPIWDLGGGDHVLIELNEREIREELMGSALIR